MNQIKPLLTHFAKKRVDTLDSNYSLHYNEELDFNEINMLNHNNKIDFFSALTNTRVKSESHDLFVSSMKNYDYLASKTHTLANGEKPDYRDPVSDFIFLSAETFTKSKGEQAD